MNRAARWAWVVAIVAASGAALVIAFLLSFASPEGGFAERHFAKLFWVTVAVAALLLLVLLLAAARLALRLKRGKFGSQLLLKLAGIFALVGVLPGLVIYTVSYQFANRSIEAWFDVRVAGALDAGLALGRSTLQSQVADLEAKARVAAARASDGGEQALAPLQLERLREQIGAAEVALVGAGGQVLAFAADSTATPERPSAALLRQARAAGVAAMLEGLDEGAAAENAAANPAGAGAAVAETPARAARVRALARVSVASLSLGAASEDRYLMLVQPLPRALASNALAVQAAYSEYQQRALSRDALRRMYIGTLTLALVLAVFGAVLLAILLGNQLARPLLLLADGVREVAAGDLSPKPVFASADELGGLTRSFADMTAQIAQGRQEVQRGVDQLEGAKAHLQTILDNLTAGVVVLSPQGRIDSVNPGATRILRQPLSAYAGQPLAAVPSLSELGQMVAQRFDAAAATPEPGEREQWQESFERLGGSGQDDVQTLLLRGAWLPGQGRLLVFDDISDVVSAQRAAAWAEVARRLAHEIKNPLTPIQLSAERLTHRLSAKLEPADAALLNRSVQTIVAQVDAMKTLVNEFRDYARLPAAQMAAVDLNALVQEVLGLYAHAQEQGLLKAALAPGLPPIQGDASQLRQVLHNLVQNALDAAASKGDAARVEVMTQATRGSDGRARFVRLLVSDNGPGFADHVLQRAFEPYITTKTKGTGLGLAVVKKIADEHRARIRLQNRREGASADAATRGALVSLSFSVLALSNEMSSSTPSKAA